MSKTTIGIGLAALGRPEYININTKQPHDKSLEAFEKNALNVLDFAYQQGIRYFDTAPSYGKGEAFLTTWHSTRQHNNVILSTKWGYTYMANWQLGFSDAHEVKEHSLAKLLEQWETSKTLLPALKIYQVHSATFESGILENTAVLEQLFKLKQQEGLQIGITTSGVHQAAIIEAALQIKLNNEDLFDSFQVTYNILEQSTHAILKQLLLQNKTVIIKEALANGRILHHKNFSQYQKLYTVLEALAKKYRVGVDAIAIRFVMDYLQPTHVLSGALTTEQLAQNIKALDFKLEPTELALLATFNSAPQHYWDERTKLSWD